MSKYHSKLAIRLIILIALSIGTGICIAFGFWWEIVVFAACIAFTIYSLIGLLDQTVEDTKRLIGGIRYSDFSVSFRNVTERGSDPELTAAMDKAIQAFNARSKKQESELIFYEILLNRIDFSIFVVNQNNEFVWTNKYAQDIFGKPVPQKIDDLHILSPEIPKLLTEMTPKDVKIVRLKAMAEDRNLIATMVSIQIQGQAMRVYSFKNIQQVIDETESEAWKKLIRILTHEMMNSITPIISLAETFSDPENETSDPEMMQKAMSTIYRRSEGLLRFVNNYQRLTRIPPPQLELIFAKEIMEDITNLLNAQGIQFSTDITPSGIQFYADRAQLEQVFINLIKNGSEACVGKENPKVEVVIRKDEYQRPVIAVSDNGAGILPEVQDKVFIPFFSTKKDGSGIGLSICRQVIQNHDGHISVASQSGKGSVFTIRL